MDTAFGSKACFPAHDTRFGFTPPFPGPSLAGPVSRAIRRASQRSKEPCQERGVRGRSWRSRVRRSRSLSLPPADAVAEVVQAAETAQVLEHAGGKQVDPVVGVPGSGLSEPGRWRDGPR